MTRRTHENTALTQRSLPHTRISVSLRTFHIVFVGTCVVLAVFLAGWAITAGDGPIRFMWAGLAAATAVLLVVYGRAFLKKILPGSENGT